MNNRRVTLERADDFAAYWSSSRVANDIDLILTCRGLRSRHIALFRGHESKLSRLTLVRKGVCQRETDERLLWTLICNCSKLEHLTVSSRNKFITNHIFWCCYRPPVSESLTSMFFDSYCKMDEIIMRLLARAVEKASVLTSFKIHSSCAYDTDITRLILGDNQLQTISLAVYCFNETEASALLLSAQKKSKWKLLRLRPKSFGAMDDLKLFIRFLQVASKSSAQLEIFESSRLPNKPELAPSKLAGVIIRS